MMFGAAKRPFSGWTVSVLTILAPLASAQGWLDAARWWIQPTEGEFRYFIDLDLDPYDDLIWFERTPGLPPTSSSWSGFRPFVNDTSGDFPIAGPLVAFPMTGNRFAPADGEGVKRMRDLTGDGLADVLVIERTSGFVAVAVHVYPADGSGGFGAPITIGLDGDLDGLAIGNADADPAGELAIIEHLGATERVTWRDYSSGTFVASASISFLSTAPFQQPRVARLVTLDLDLDGDDDLCFGERSKAMLQTFFTVGGAPTAGTSVPLPFSGTPSVYPIVADLSGGSSSDLLAIGASPGTASAQFAPLPVLGGAPVPGATQTITSQNGSALGGDGFDLCDWDGDGALDLCYFPWQKPGGTTEGIVALFRNIGATVFAATPSAEIELVHSDAIAVGPTDLDRDGHLDFVGKQSAHFGRSRFESVLVSVVDPFVGGHPRGVFDLEGDGDLDLFFDTSGPFFVGAMVARNDGTGAFVADLFTPAAPAGLQAQLATAVGDFTGDGHADFLLPMFVPGTLQNPIPTFAHMRLHAWNGLTGFVDGGIANTVPMSPASAAGSLVSDFDLDGDLDVGGPGGYFPNAGNGTFGSLVNVFPSGHEPLAAGDLDLDGDTDFIATVWSGSGNGLATLLRQGSGTFTASPIPGTGAALFGKAVGLGDGDLDGDLDLISATSYTDEVIVWANDGLAGFAIAAILESDLFTFGADPSFQHLAFADVDGDLVPDLMAGAEELFEVPEVCAIYRGTGGLAFEPARFFAARSLGIPADLDSDGDLDFSGRAIVRNRRFDGPDDGIVRQYGSGVPGSGGAKPLLGARGPLRPGSTTAEFRLRLALGGAPLALYVGFAPAAIANAPFPGATFLIQPPVVVLGVVAGGTAGVPGAGQFDVPMGSVLPSLVGISLYVQCGFVDPGAVHGKTVSNGVQLTFGG